MFALKRIVAVHWCFFLPLKMYLKHKAFFMRVIENKIKCMESYLRITIHASDVWSIQNTYMYVRVLPSMQSWRISFVCAQTKVPCGSFGTVRTTISALWHEKMLYELSFSSKGHRVLPANGSIKKRTEKSTLRKQAVFDSSNL